MALQKKLVSIPFNVGADTKTSDIVMQPGQLEVLENAVFEKTGRIEKRKGCSTVEWSRSDGDVPAGSYAYRDNLIIEGDDSLISLVGSDNDTVVLQSGRNNFIESEIFHATKGAGHHQQNASIAISHSGDYIAIAWTQAYFNYTTYNVNYEYGVSILDAVTHTIVNSGRVIYSDARADKVHPGKIKVVAHAQSDEADDNFAAYYEYVDGSGNIELRKTIFKHYDSALTGTSVIVVADTSTYRQTAAEASFDVVEHKISVAADYRKVHIVFTEYNGGHSARYYLDTNGTLSETQDFAQSGAMTQLVAYRSDAGGTARFYFAFAVGVTLSIRQQQEAASGTDQYLATHSVGSGLTVIESGGFCDSEDGTKVEYFTTVGTSSATFQSKTSRYQITPDGTGLNTYSAPLMLNSWTPLGPLKTSSSLQYFMCHENRNTDDNDTFLHTPVAWTDTADAPPWLLGWIYRSIVGSTFRQELIRSHVNGVSTRFVSDGTHSYSALPRTTNVQTFADGSGGVTTAINSSCHLIKITNVRPTHETPRTQLGGQLFIAPGCIKATSGDKIHEAGFFYKPSIKVVEAAAGSLTSTGVYKYKAVWEWEDSYGNLHRSEPSDVESLTLTSSNTGVTITSDCLSATMKGGVSLVIYRTQNGGSIYNKVATLSSLAMASPTAIPAISHIDKLSDANAATGAYLYTEGGELANVAPPASRYVESHRNRIFAITEDNRIWFSKEYENKIGLGFSDEFQIPMDGLDHDKPTALCSSGTELYIFRENSTWLISGEGPSKTGVGEFYKPRQVSANIGALKGSTTFYSDSGIYFQNTRGIFSIGQEGIQYVGAPVEDLVGDSRVIAIRHHQKTETIRFALSDKVLAYNYRYNTWSNYTYSLSEDEVIVGMECLNDIIQIVTNQDNILKEDSSYKVGANYIVLKMRTGWISFNEIQGFGRAYRFALLGESRDKHVLTVKVYYDYDDSAAVDTYEFTTSEAADAVLQFRAHLSKQKCQAVKFEIYDADHDSASVGDGFAIDQITIEVGTKKGIFRTAQTTNTIGAS